MRGRRLALFGIIAAGAAWLPLRAEVQQPEPTFRATSELLVIDMVAVDAQGRFIDDLRPDEIDVREDGRRQPVQLLRVVGRDVAAATTAPSAPAPSPPSAATDVPDRASTSPSSDVTVKDASRRLVLLVDAHSLEVDAVARIKDALLTSIADLPGDLPVMLAAIDGDLIIRQPFTTDRQALSRAIGGLPTQLAAPPGTSRPSTASARPPAIPAGS